MTRGENISTAMTPIVAKRDFAGARSFAQPRLLLLLTAALLLGGCTGFVYNRIDNFAAAYIRNLVTLNDGQRAALDQWLGQTLDWHRETELKRYRDFLNEVRAQAAQPQPASTYVDSAARVESFFRDLAQRGAPEAARLLCTLNAQQADEFLASLSERDEEEREEREEMTAEELTRERTKRLQRQARNWLGKLSDEQKQMIAQTAAKLPSTTAQYESRVGWRTALRAELAQTPQGCRSTAAVEALLLDPQRFWTPQYAREIETNRRISVELLTALDASLTPQQREHVQDKLADWSRTLTSLLEP